MLGGVGAAEILLTMLSGGSTGHVVEFVGATAESEAVNAVLAAVSLVGLNLGPIATVTSALFFGYTVYEFLPGVFPEELQAVADRPAYRLLAAGIVVWSARLVGGLVAGSRPGEMTVTATLVATVPLVACVAYVGSVVSRDAADIETASRAVSKHLDLVGPGSGEDATETASTTTRLAHVVRVGVMLGAPLPFFATAVFAAGFLYPIPESLAIGWALLGGVDRRSDRDVLDRLPNRDRTDVEGSFLDLVVNVVRSPKGPPAVMVTLFGFGGAVSVVRALNTRVLRFAREGVSVVRSDPLFAWATLGMVAVLFAAGLFAVWFWVRVTQRVPAYLRAWNVASAETSPLADEELPDPVTRPVGLLVPFTVTIVPATVFADALRFDYFFGARTAVLAAYGVAWPLSLGVLWWAVRRTRRVDPQPPLSDGRALLVALLVEYLWFLQTGPVTAFFGRASGMRYPPEPDGFRVLLFLLLGTVFLFVDPAFGVRAKAAEGWRSHQQQLARIGFGVACGVGALLGVVPEFGLMLGLVAAVFTLWPAWTLAKAEIL